MTRLAIITAAALALGACSRAPEGQIVDRGADVLSGIDGIRAFRDPKSGCEYLTLYSDAITPRLGADGKPSCGGAK